MTIEELDSLQGSEKEVDIEIDDIESDEGVETPNIEPEETSKEEPFSIEISDEPIDIEVPNEQENVSLDFIRGTGESQYDTNTPYSVLDDPLKQERIRGKNQPFHHEWANAAGRLATTVVGKGISGFGTLFEMAKGNNIALESENALIEIGKAITDFGDSTLPIYQTQEGGSMFGDSEDFFETMISIGSTLSMLIPAAGTVRAISAVGKLAGNLSKGSRVLSKLVKAGKLSKKSKWLANGVSQAVLSRQIESTMEASGIYEELLQEGLSKKAAREAAEKVYYENWVMLLQDIPQYLAIGKIFNPLTGKMVSKAPKKALFSGKNKYRKALKKYGVVSTSEAVEEAYQFNVGETAKHGIRYENGLVDYESVGEKYGDMLGNSEFWNSVVMGGLGGALFQGIGDIVNRRTARKQNKRYFEQRDKLLNDLFSNISNEESPEINKKIANLYMTISAINNDRFDNHLEMLEGFENLTPEEILELEEKHQVKIDTDKVKESFPELKKDALKLRERYLKLANKYGASAAEIAYGELLVDEYSKNKDLQQQEINNIKSSIPNFNELSSHAQEKIDIHSKIKALDVQSNNEMMSVLMDDTIEDKEVPLKKIKNKIDKLREIYKNELSELKDERTDTEKEMDKGIEEALMQEGEENILSKYISALAKYDSYKSLLNKQVKRNNFLTSSEGKQEAVRNEIKTKLSNAAKEEDVYEVKKEAEERGMKLNISDKLAEIKKIKEEKFKSIAETLNDPNKNSSSLPAEEKQLYIDNKVEIDNLAENLKKVEESSNPETSNNDDQPNEESDFSQVEREDVTGKKSLVFAAVKKEMNPTFSEWLEQPFDKTNLTPEFTYEPSDEYDSIVVRFLNEDGSYVKHNGEIVYTFLYEKGTEKTPLSKTYAEFRDKIKSFGPNVKVKGSITGQSALPFAEKTGEFLLTDVVGQEFEIVYTDKKGQYRDKDKKSFFIGTKTKSKRGRPGEIYIPIIDNTGKEVPFTVGRSKLNDEQAEFIYEVIREKLIEGKEFNDEISEELKSKSPVNSELFGDLTYSKVLEFFVYNNVNTHNYPKTRLYFAKKGEALHYSTTIPEEISENPSENKKLPPLVATAENVESSKQSIISFLKNNKRHNVSVDLLHNSDYVEYLISNKYIYSDKPKIFKTPDQVKGDNESNGTLFFDFYRLYTGAEEIVEESLNLEEESGDNKLTDEATDSQSAQQTTNVQETSPDSNVILLKKDKNSNWSVIVEPDGTVINSNTNRKITDSKLINRAHIKSNFISYENVSITNKKDVTFTYAVTEDDRIINNTENSASQGNEISPTSGIGKKVLSKINKTVEETKESKDSLSIKEPTENVVPDSKSETMSKDNINESKQSRLRSIKNKKRNKKGSRLTSLPDDAKTNSEKKCDGI